MEAASARGLPVGAPASGALNRLRSDHRLAERFAAGDDGAFAVLYERHRRRLLAICIGVLGSYDDAQDALQNALAGATTALRDRTPEHVGAWLARVARNAAIDLARARRITARLEGDEPALSGGPDATAQERADIEDLVSSLRRLPEHQRTALVMRELAGSSYAEIASALELDETAVRGLIARARMSLRAELEASELACATVREELAHQPDGRRRPAIVRRHLRACDGCRDYARALRSDAHALRGLAPAAGALSLAGVASILRLTRPVAIGGAVAKGAFGAGAIQAVVACAVCLTAVEGVREVVVTPPRHTPHHARAAAHTHPTAAAAATSSASGTSASRLVATRTGAPPAAADDRRQVAQERRRAASRRLHDGAAPAFVPGAAGFDPFAEGGYRGGYGGRWRGDGGYGGGSGQGPSDGAIDGQHPARSGGGDGGDRFSGGGGRRPTADSYAPSGYSRPQYTPPTDSGSEPVTPTADPVPAPADSTAATSTSDAAS